MSEEKLEKALEYMKMYKCAENLIYHGNVTGQIGKASADFLMCRDPEFQRDMIELQEKYKNKYKRQIEEL